MGYADINDLKAWRGMNASVTPDGILLLAINSASAEIDQACSRSFIPSTGTPSDRYYTPRYDRTLMAYVIDIDDLQTLTGLAIHSDTLRDGTYSTVVDVTGVRGYPYNANGKPWSQLRLPRTVSAMYPVKVTADWGWTTTPDVVKLACLMQASRNFTRKDSDLGLAGSTDAGFGETRLLSSLDPDVRLLLKTVMKYWGAAATGDHSVWGYNLYSLNPYWNL